MTPSAHYRRGRPPKFGRPSAVVALTLPKEVIEGLRALNPDVARAVVALFEKRRPRTVTVHRPRPDAELTAIARQSSLIIVNRTRFNSLPGVQVVPLEGDRGFLALDPGRGMSDLELAVVDRLESHALSDEERKALRELRASLRVWRLDPMLRVRTRAIIVIEHIRRRRAGERQVPERRRTGRSVPGE